ncbi:MAG TPA: class I SAM-dependent methyltransferase [Stackebrandtia sp.]|uniref:class I SAM-dependent methyltransferase n=1 Tax=Stackebrandtia sp. TaxID=2023065 RepID=UPI002D6F2203|nr:class I SAM-dependent methyltransferase [Stackebrandtia sp.]HZE40455.1 class I SAM-dependent methyltransferase [Stackebrandtia sp.]
MPSTRPHGYITRGTTNPDRLRRMDRWLAPRVAGLLRGGRAPLVVDVGFGASPVTTRQLRDRLARIRSDVCVVGVEIDRRRVAEARAAAVPGRLEFVHGGFELAGLRPLVVRAANVLRQYDEDEVADAWRRMRRVLAPGGVILEGTCDEIGRVAAWVLLDERGPLSLTLAARLANLDSPAVIAERLPKALIHHNVAGEPIHALVSAVDEEWRSAAPSRVFGPRDRWRRCLDALSAKGWPIREPPARRRDGTLTVPWDAVRPGS